MSTKNFFILCMWLFAASLVQAQDKLPQAISYQAVARDAQGKVVSEKPIGVKVEILKGSASGTVVFSETHTPTSSKTGTINLLIGQGTTGSGTFASIDWGSETYFLQLSMDLTGGSNYEKVSTTQMLPVPYALYAAKAGEVENGGSSSGNTNNIRAYAITSTAESGEFNKMISTGKTITTQDSSAPRDEYKVDFEFSILYLTGIDLGMSAEIEGVKISENNYSSGSSKIGHCFRFFAIVYPEDIGKTIKLLIKDKEGNVVEEFPLVVTEYKRDW